MLAFAPEPVKKQIRTESGYEKKARELVQKLTDEELTAMVIGEISKGQGQALGSAGSMVPGSAGETSGILKEKIWDPGCGYGRPDRQG